MMLVEYILIAMYFTAIAFIFSYSLIQLDLLRLYRRASKRDQKSTELNRHPLVCIQLPIYNERYVVERLIETVCRIDYPKNLLEVQVLDDSTDDTVQIAGAMVAKMKTAGLDIVYIYRADRRGFKAGALKEGLKTAKGELIAVFDADFVPNPDFLKESVPYFKDPQIGMLQIRWGHINSEYSMLTRAQSIGIDGHFGVDPASRAWNGASSTRLIVIRRTS